MTPREAEKFEKIKRGYDAVNDLVPVANDLIPVEIKGERSMDRQLVSFRQADFSNMSLPMITIYDHPLDYPNAYVARVWEAKTLTPTNVVVCKKNLEELRKDIQAAGFLVRIDGKVEADPVILETWI